MPRGMKAVSPPKARPRPKPVKPTGVRLFHEDLRNCTIVVVHPKREYRVPFECPTCNQTHRWKAYHLNLDDQGSVIVSEAVYKRLREAGMPGLSVANKASDPPPQTLYMGGSPQVFEAEEISMGRGRRKLTVLRRKNG